jgi:hypothetical protein
MTSHMSIPSLRISMGTMLSSRHLNHRFITAALSRRGRMLLLSFTGAML